MSDELAIEASGLAGQIAVLNGGVVVAEGTAAELKRRVAAQRLDLTCPTAGAFGQVSRLLAGHAVHLDPAVVPGVLLLTLPRRAIVT